jgi:hypothetical protein
MMYLKVVLWDRAYFTWFRGLQILVVDNQIAIGNQLLENR